MLNTTETQPVLVRRLLLFARLNRAEICVCLRNAGTQMTILCLVGRKTICFVLIFVTDIESVVRKVINAIHRIVTFSNFLNMFNN